MFQDQSSPVFSEKVLVPKHRKGAFVLGNASEVRMQRDEPNASAFFVYTPPPQYNLIFFGYNVKSLDIASKYISKFLKRLKKICGYILGKLKILELKKEF